MAKYFFVLCGYNMIDISNNRMVTPNTIVLTPNVGIRKNPAKKVPTILPMVDKDDVFPDILPTSSNSLSFSLTAYGDTIAITKLGIPKTTAAAIKATTTKFPDSFTKFSTNMVSMIGIKLVKIAPNKIKLDRIPIFGFLSANFPPIQYPKLMLVSITPIMVVQIKLELPTYGDKTLAATNSNIIPIAPHKNTVISSLYFLIFFLSWCSSRFECQKIGI